MLLIDIVDFDFLGLFWRMLLLIGVIVVVRKINVSKSGNGSSDAKDGNSLHQPQPNGPQQESKLELFGFDSLVNILGLKRYFTC
jgi:hypothetical protein